MAQPIISLTPFLGGKPTIQARVTDKSPIRTWNKPNNSGKLFSCTLIDESAAVRATFFNDQVDAFEPILQEGQVYTIQGFQVKNANRRFSNVNNDYELSMNSDARMELVTAPTVSIPTVRYNFCPIQVLPGKEKNSTVDVLCVVTAVAEPSKIVTRAEGKELLKRAVTVADKGSKVDLTVWDNLAMTWDHPVGSVVALRNVRVNTWDGVSLTFGRESIVEVNPPLPETADLSAWFSSTGAAGIETITTGRQQTGDRGGKGRVNFSTIDKERFGCGEKPDYCDVRAVPVYVRTDGAWYDACPKCNRKVTQQQTGWHCNQCDAAVPQCDARYITSIQVSDGTTLKWMTLFQEAGEVFWGSSANELKKASEIDAGAVARIAQERLYVPFIITARCKLEERSQPDGGSTSEIRLTAVRMVDVFNNGNTSAECRALTAAIEAYHI